jgi:hypothetical protein
MAAILITYDLKSPGQKYEKVHETIRNQGAWWHQLESTWIVAGSTLTAQGVSDALVPHLDANDTLLCLNISGDARQGWLPQTAWDWIKQHV